MEVAVVNRLVACRPLRHAVDQADVELRRQVAARLDPPFAMAVVAGLALAAAVRVQFPVVLAAALAARAWCVEIAAPRLHRNALMGAGVLRTRKDDDRTVAHGARFAQAGAPDNIARRRVARITRKR